MGEVQWFKQQQVILCCYKTLGFLSWLWQPSTDACTYPKAFKSQLLLTIPFMPLFPWSGCTSVPLSALQLPSKAKSYQTSWVTHRNQ